MKLKRKHFYNTADFTQEELWFLVDFALKLKHGQVKQSLSGKILAMLFFNPSLRTRVSFTVAMQKLGGLAIDIPIKENAYQLEFKKRVVMDKLAAEHIKEAALVLSRYCDAVAVRESTLVTHVPEGRRILSADEWPSVQGSAPRKPALIGAADSCPRGSTSDSETTCVSSWQELKEDRIIRGFMEYASVPVINMESNVYHPCQGLADMVTLVEKLRLKTPRECQPRPVFNGKSSESKKKFVFTWAPHPKALPMATTNSQLLTACDLGMKVFLTHPVGWELDANVLKTAEQRAKESGGRLTVSHNQLEAFEGADVICAKSWGAFKYYGKWQEEKKKRDKLKHWIVNKKKMDLTNNAYFMHCLPVRRNVVVTDEVLDSKNSIVYDQAENRVWAQMAILLYVVQN